MASFSNEERILNDITSSRNTLREIQTEHMIYQLNSSSEAKKAIDKMRKDIDTVSKAMENARKTAYEKKLASDELKISLAEKKDHLKQLQKELERNKNQVELAAKKTLDLETESNKVRSAIEKIRNATEEIDAKYLGEYQNELARALVKLTSQTQKAQSDFNAAKAIEEIVLKKIQDAEEDYSKSEAQTMQKASEADRIISNVSMTIEHIIKSYDEITAVSKELLKSSTNTRLEFENTDMASPAQELNEVTV